MSETNVVDVVETLEPSATIYSVEIGDRTFVQRPLSFFGKIEFFAVLGDAVEKALSSGTTVTELLETPGNVPGAVGEADAFVRAISQIAQVAPELLQEVFCIALGIRRGDRDEVKELMENELTDAQGNAILEQFVDQNWEAMVDFFEAQSNLVKKVSEKMQSRSTSSKPSKATRQRTPKR